MIDQIISHPTHWVAYSKDGQFYDCSVDECPTQADFERAALLHFNRHKAAA